ncbi:nucleosome assembly protein [Xylariomycetidae sp. FL0641]|nr:nucleosome assembly protein [Xylariomycetidae sp. FL0641]
MQDNGTEAMDAVAQAAATYDELENIQNEFEDADNEIIRQQYALTKPIYEKREKVISKIENFWPLVFEQAPQLIDQYIQPRDSALFLTKLKSFSVSRFEIDDGGKGHPRSVAIKMEFDENEFFEDKVLEKKFWYRFSEDTKGVLVSEPVAIKWKSSDNDLTRGLLDMAVKVWEEDQKHSKTKEEGKKELRADQKALKEKIQSVGLGGASFFAWFGYRGPYITAEESRIASEKERKQREAKDAAEKAEEDDEEDGDEDEDDPFELEIFPDGDELAVAFSEDLWPLAIKYFYDAQEADEDDLSSLEDGDEELDAEEEDDDEAPPLKRQKN